MVVLDTNLKEFLLSCNLLRLGNFNWRICKDSKREVLEMDSWSREGVKKRSEIWLDYEWEKIRLFSFKKL